jgi:amino acid permease
MASCRRLTPLSIENNRDALQNVPLIRRWNRGTNTMADDFPYRSHGQPITAYASLIACLFILIVANGAGLWKEFHVQPFLSAYLAVSYLNHHNLWISSNNILSLSVSSASGSR